MLMTSVSSAMQESNNLSEATLNLPPQFYNEMTANSGENRISYEHFTQWLNQQTIEQLRTLNAQATAQFFNKGITFTVYSDDTGTERVIPFDIIPRIIEKKEWSILETGCDQRIRALNAFLHDIYHHQDIIRAGIIPAEQVIAHDCFQPWMLNVDLPGKIYSD